jgi:nitrate reductase gamma subunit
MADVDLARTFWNVSPYVALAAAGMGSWWRYRYDQFGWTSRSSQLYESRLLQIGSPMFHFGSLVVIMGHVVGLMVPASVTDALGISDNAYHLQALLMGAPAGVITIVGLGLLIYRRWTNAAVSKATTGNDKLMYVVLVCALLAGMICTLMARTDYGEMHDYRDTVSVWFRSIITFHPRGDLMKLAPLYFHVHVVIALVLFAVWPFTRLVHAFSAPIGYLFRPYIVYRSRDEASKDQLIGSVPRRRGW